MLFQLLQKLTPHTFKYRSQPVDELKIHTRFSCILFFMVYMFFQLKKKHNLKKKFFFPNPRYTIRFKDTSLNFQRIMLGVDYF